MVEGLKNVLGQKCQPLSLIMGVPNKTSLHNLDIVDTGATVTLNKIGNANHSQGIFKYMYLKPPWSSYNYFTLHYKSMEFAWGK